MSATPIAIDIVARRRLGEHNDEIYGGLLGRRREQITELRALGAI